MIERVGLLYRPGHEDSVGLSVALGREFAKAVQGVPENELALPFGEPTPLPLHGLARRVAPLMLIRYRRMDRSEI